MKPNLFIVGKPKSGTTALYNFLKQHPQIDMPVKEPSFFCTDFHEESDRFHGKPLKFPIRKFGQYLSLFLKHKKGVTYVGEASTLYMYSKKAASNIYNFNPNSKIIIMLREPVNFLISLHRQNYFDYVEDIENFEDAIKAEKYRKKWKRVPMGSSFPSELFYTERVNYDKEIKRYLRFFPEENVKVIIFEEFIRDNRSTYSEIIKFLNIKKFYPIFRMYNTKNKQMRLSFIRKFILKYKIGHRMRRFIPLRLYNSLAKTFNVITTRKKIVHNRVNEDLILLLKTKFKKNVKRVEKILNRNVIKIWGYENV